MALRRYDTGAGRTPPGGSDRSAPDPEGPEDPRPDGRARDSPGEHGTDRHGAGDEPPGTGRTAGRRRVFPAAVAVFAALCLALVVQDARMPAARGPDAPADAFSAARAGAHVREIADAPRPSGSPAHTRAREYIVRTLTALGIDAQVHTGAAAAHRPDLSPTAADSRYAGLRLENVVARIPGTASTRPVALVTHYDSTEAGPGANDAGVPVSVLLETARALRTGPPPRNDVLLVFTDAEESGLLGAQALVDAPGALPPDAVVLNFEARGSRGPSLMFETGPDAAWLVDTLAGKVPGARADSLLDAAYGYMPNLTDFTVFQEAGHQGLNLAYLDGYTHYHGATDTPDQVDPATVQHQGDQALGLARALGSADLAHTPAGNSAYFRAGGLFVSYPLGAALPAALVVAGLGLALLLRLRARGALTVGDVCRGFLVALGQLLLAAGAAFFLAPLTASGHAEFPHYYDIGGHGTALAGFLVFALAVGSALALLARRWARPGAQVAGAALLWILLSLVTAVLLPGGSHVFVWPTLGLLAAVAVLTSRAGTTVRGQVLAAALGTVPCALLVFPLLPLLTNALGLGLVAAPVAVASLLTALLPGVLPRLPRLLPVTAAVVATAVLAGTALLPPEREQPVRSDLLYLWDADRRTAHWIGRAPSDDWSDRFLPADAERGSVADLWPGWRVPVRRGPADAFPLPGPRVTSTVVGDSADGGRRVRLTAVSGRGADELVIVVSGAAVRGWSLSGVPGRFADDPDGDAAWELWVRQVPARGAELELELAAGPATVRVIDRTPGLPGPAADGPGDTRAPALGVASVGEATLAATTRTLG
ncbi:M28 family peptidase [Streptomyces sp. NBC_01498]|uniref:M28 family peptidase n=1 Tax=Streptomyces sp. NBC_01498 TaxID=2975870 RepID=UPI002E7BDC45|nr:M28 family peptidase [Streptomyces sp. NBC_01498]WTL28368.1 M28 family peptidase [Streptomyces sp. NBC_01498]